MDKEILLEKMSNLNKNTMATTIGLELTDVGKDYVCGKIPIDKRTIQPFGFLHGGASVALAETLGSIAGQMQVEPEREIVLGIAINANHIKSVRKGWVYGKASSINIGKKIQVWEIQITDEEKKMVCISRLTLAVLKKR